MDLKNVIIEGTRRMEEVKPLEDELPNLDMALKFPNAPGNFQGVHLGVEEWRVVSFINPKNSIRQIAKACNMTDTEIRRVVYALLQAGLVELVKPPSSQMPKQGAPSSRRAAAAQASPQAVAMKRSVVERLITKIKDA